MGTPPTPLPPGPPISVTVTDVADHEIDPKQRAKLETLGQQDAGFFSDIWANFWAGAMHAAGNVVSLLSQGIDKLLVLVGDLFLKAQGEENPEMWELAATIVTDLTGVPVNAEELKKARFGSGRLAAMDVLGRDLFNLLAQEFTATDKQASSGKDLTEPGSGIGGLPANKLTPEQGVIGAHRFLGFVMSFAIRQGNISAITQLLPNEFRLAEGFREYGELMAKNLGLGRLTRQALRPMVGTLIGDPLQQALNKQYRPKKLSAGSAIQAWLNGIFTDDELAEELALEGLDLKRQTATTTENLKTLSIEDLYRLTDADQITPEDFDKTLARLGYHPDQRAQLKTVHDLKLLFDEDSKNLGHALSLFNSGLITQDEYIARVRFFGKNDQVKSRLEQLVTLGFVGPVKTLTLTQMREAYIHGTIDLLEFEDYLSRVGYRSDDRKILTIELLVDARADAQKQALAAEREAEREARRAAAAAKAAGVLPPQ